MIPSWCAWWFWGCLFSITFSERLYCKTRRGFFTFGIKTFGCQYTEGVRFCYCLKLTWFLCFGKEVAFCEYISQFFRKKIFRGKTRFTCSFDRFLKVQIWYFFCKDELKAKPSMGVINSYAFPEELSSLFSDCVSQCMFALREVSVTIASRSVLSTFSVVNIFVHIYIFWITTKGYTVLLFSFLLLNYEEQRKKPIWLPNILVICKVLKINTRLFLLQTSKFCTLHDKGRFQVTKQGGHPIALKSIALDKRTVKIIFMPKLPSLVPISFCIVRKCSKNSKLLAFFSSEG